MKLYHINMRTSLIFCFMLLGSLCANSQGDHGMSQEEFQAKLVGEKHVHVNGTNLFIIPPDSFSLAVIFPGFIEESSGANILIRKGQSSYLNTVEMYSSPQTLDQKLKNAQWKSEKIKIKKKDGFFVSSENSDPLIHEMVKWIFVYQDEESCFILEGNYPSSLAGNYSKKIKDSISTIVIQ
jgi:hypothetical protein